MYKFFGFVLISIFISGCGYKPSAQYTKDVLGERIHVEVAISRKDPKNSVIIKDAVNEAVITRFGGKLSTKELADSQLYAKIGSTIFSPILYDKDGYVVSYKAKVSLSIKYITKNGKKESFSTSGEYDFPIEANSVISDTNRFEAIKFASLDALNEVISKIAMNGMKR